MSAVGRLVLPCIRPCTMHLVLLPESRVAGPILKGQVSLAISLAILVLTLVHNIVLNTQNALTVANQVLHGAVIPISVSIVLVHISLSDARISSERANNERVIIMRQLATSFDHVFLKVAAVNVAVGVGDHSFSTLLAIHERTFILRSIRPFLKSLPRSLAILEHASVVYDGPLFV